MDFCDKFVGIIGDSIVNHCNLAGCAGNLHLAFTDIACQFSVIRICFVVAAAKSD